jgi:GTP-dependent phosphoenolpyruvate carboxykinase
MPLTNFVESWVDETVGLELDGLNIAPDRVEAALHVERDAWIESLQDLGEFYRQFGSRLSAAISAGLATTARRLTT